MITIELTSLDNHFAQKMVDYSGTNISDEFADTVKLLCNVTTSGNVCLELSEFSSKEIMFKNGEEKAVRKMPEIDYWISVLQQSQVVGVAGEEKPLLLDKSHQRLYLFRYWQYEQQLMQSIIKMIKMHPFDIDEVLLEIGLKRLFKDGETDKAPIQAVKTALKNQFCIITGGPGTGKTTTVTKILALLLEQNIQLKIALTAPTGKAAARLKESVLSGKERIKEHISSRIYEQLKEKTHTIHRLLGSRKNSIYFKHNETNPLDIDCLVVDEASMVDLALMSKLVSALPKHTRLILLGDRNQLSSVEAGAVFGDLCSENADQLKNNIVHLTKSHRFNAEEGIGKISHLVLDEKGTSSYETLISGNSNQISWKELPDALSLKQFIQQNIIQEIKEYLLFQTIDDAFKKFKSFIILTALKRRIFGSDNINRLIEELLVESGSIPPDNEWYHGKPILITRNDYSMMLFNGDLGICHMDHDDNKVRVYFESDNGYRKISPSRLPNYESVYAMTIHKSQGSEFEKVLLVLPDKDTEILSKELIYTGITRTKRELEIWGKKDVFIKAVQRSVKRSSGLIDGLKSN